MTPKTITKGPLTARANPNGAKLWASQAGRASGTRSSKERAPGSSFLWSAITKFDRIARGSR